MISQKAKTERVFKYSFFIGSNNDTKKTEPLKAIEILNKHKVLGYTLNEGLKGFWEGMSEDSFKIEIIATPENPFNDAQARSLKADLEKGLSQFLVLVEKNSIVILK